MYCPNCAATIDGVKFCRSCGSNVSLVPQAMSGHTSSADLKDKWRQGHHHLDWGNHRHSKKEPSIERAVNCFFSGMGFLLAAMVAVYFSPPGFKLGWVFLFPAFWLFFAGGGQYLQLKEQQRQQRSLNRPEARPAAEEPSEQSPKLSAPTTSELIKPPDVTEHTTRRLDKE
jgi:hypothetical protein